MPTFGRLPPYDVAMGSSWLANKALTGFDSSFLTVARSQRAQWICGRCQYAQANRSFSGRGDGAVSVHVGFSGTAELLAVNSSRTVRAIRAFSGAARRFQEDQRSSRVSSKRDDAIPGSPEKIQEASERVQRFVTVTRQSWNELVGYTEIEKNRARVSEQEDLIRTRKLDLQLARDSYRAAVDKHAGSLRETRDLLARKDDWSGQDAARFATLHTGTRADESAEQATRRALQAAELALERETEQLSSKIGAVYQAESMYNAKILQVKTWWTWALMTFNVTVFLFNVYLIQLGLNPRYRKDMNLSEESIAKIRSALRDQPPSTVAKETAYEATTLTEIALASGTDDARPRQGHSFSISLPEPSTAAVSGDPQASKIPRQLDTIQDRLKALFSPAPVTWQMSEITTLALQSATAGAAAAALVVMAIQKG